MHVLAPEQSAVPAFAHRCKRVRHRQNNCSICQDVCPEGAITLDPGPVVSERCTRCGLCQTACPTEVFQGEVHSDQRLLGRIEPMVPAARRATAGQELFVHCSEAEPPHHKSVAVPCLGSLTGNFLLGAVVLGANPLRLVRGDCDSCRLRAGKALLDRAMVAYTALASGLELDSSAVKLEQRSAQASSARRRFLTRVAMGNGNWPAPGTDAGARGTDKPGGGATPGRALLQALLRGNPGPSSLRYNADLPWARVKIDQRNCVACGTCVNLCPTGAITRRIEHDRLSHYFTSSLCINCGLCQEACPQQVISFEPEFDVRDLMREEPQAITDIRLHACAICGEMLAEREGRFCITCQRRGLVESRTP